MASWAENTLAAAADTLGTLGRLRNTLPDDVGADADRLLALRGKLVGRIKSVSEGGFGVLKTRHHGDYHLGQVLVVGNDFQIIDFEGEPGKPLAERREKHSPLRDVAGMLCSFNYAVRTVLTDLRAERAEWPERLVPYVRLWERRARRTFLEGYAEGVQGAASYPEKVEHALALVELFTIEKALRDLREDLGKRPDPVGLPIRGVLHLLEEPLEEEYAGFSAPEA